MTTDDACADDCKKKKTLFHKDSLFYFFFFELNKRSANFKPTTSVHKKFVLPH